MACKGLAWGAYAATLTAVLGPLACGCGARTDLLGFERDAQASPDATAIPDAGRDAIVPVDAAQDVLPESPITPDAAPDVLPDAPLPPRCVLLQSDGPPMQIVSFSNQHADAPSLAVVDRGAPGSPANVAVQAFRSGGDGFEHAIFAGKMSVGDAWPDGVEMTQAPVKVGTDSHGWAEMSVAPGGLREIAISWLGDPGMSSRTMFRRIDADSWSAHDPVDLSYEGSSALGLVAGAGTGDMGIGYAGIGYGIVWRLSSHLPDNPVSPVVAVLDQEGSLLIGPHRVADPMPYPGRSPSITWSGSAYLLATTFRECVPGDPLCSPDAIVITRVRPASGDAWDDSGVDVVTAIPTTNPGLAPGRASIGSNGTDTWVAWSEGPPGNDEAPRRLLAQRLDSQGNVVGSPVQVDDGIRLLMAPRVHVSPFGLTIVWPEDGDANLGYNDVGRSRIAVALLTPNATGPVVTRVDTTHFGSYGWASGVSIDEPHGMLVTWPGYPLTGGMGVAWLARLSCVEQQDESR